MWEQARCPKERYCWFEVTFKNHEVQKERCKFCGKRVIYNVKAGRVDNARYLEDHVRDFCQPSGRTGKVFDELYHRQKKENLAKIKDFQRYKSINSDVFWEEAREDARKALNELRRSPRYFT